MGRLAIALFLAAFAFGPLPQSDAVRARLARAGLVSSGVVGSEAPTTTTTLPPVEVADLNNLLTSSGYPDVDATEVDRVVTLRGIVPDVASRQLVVRLVREVPGVAEVIDETVVASPGSTGDVTISGTTSGVTLAGSVPDEETASLLLDAVGSVYVADQIAGAVTVDNEVAAPAEVVVTLESTRSELAERLGDALDTIDPALASIDLRFRQLEIPRLEEDLAELLAAEPIEFAVGSSQIEDASQATLDAVTALLEASPTAIVEVGGHTDDTGSDAANRQLSLERAEAVVDALLDRGVAATLEPVGYGETRPRIVPADTDAARAANRRIEFILIEP
ncbi:MAG: OmpA family protein [Acidimicrobiales bacterium]